MIFEIATAIGLGLNLWGQISGASAKSEASRRNAELKQLQAQELLERQAINEGIAREQSEKAQSRYVTAFAASGVEGAGIGGVLQMKSDLERSLENSRRDAEYKARMLRAGAEIDTGLASDVMTAGYIGGASTILTSGADYYLRKNRYGSPDKSTKGLW